MIIIRVDWTPVLCGASQYTVALSTLLWLNPLVRQVRFNPLVVVFRVYHRLKMSTHVERDVD